MKVLMLVGHESGEWRRDKLRSLARVWQDRQFRPHVEAVGKGTHAFASAVERAIYERLARPNGGFVRHVGTLQQPHVRKLSKPESPDFLEALKDDDAFWELGNGYTDFVGFYVFPTGCRIIEE